MTWNEEVRNLVAEGRHLPALVQIKGLLAADGYEVGGAVRRLVSETGVHLAVLWPTTEIPWADPDTVDPDLAAAFARGATWSREEAVERAGVLAAEMAGGSSAATQPSVCAPRVRLNRCMASNPPTSAACRSNCLIIAS